MGLKITLDKEGVDEAIEKHVTGLLGSAASENMSIVLTTTRNPPGYVAEIAVGESKAGAAVPEKKVANVPTPDEVLGTDSDMEAKQEEAADAGPGLFADSST